MAGFTKLLLCISDDGDDDVRYMARIAARTGAHLTIVDVLEDVPRAARRLLPASWNLPALVRDEKQARLESSGALARRLGAHTTTALLSGSPIKSLVREVRRGGHDLLAVGAAPSGTVQGVKASATRLLRETPCAVLLINPTRHRHRPRLLVAVDTDPWKTKGKAALTTRLLKTAILLAEKHDYELHVMHAWIPYAERMMVRAGVTRGETQQFLAGIREESREELERSLAPVRERIDPKHIHLVKGDPRVVIAQFAASSGIDLLVVGSVGRTGVTGRIIGNTAESIVNRLPCSMLVVQPPPAHR
jgi:nucleotide-binding universal stress UspA family protein